MQIFVTSNCPVQSAQYLDDRRVQKMIIESCQLLSNACWTYRNIGPYKQTHQHTKLSRWVSLNASNYLWLLWHCEALLDEYYKRFNKSSHKCASYIGFFYQSIPYFPEGDLTAFVNKAENLELGLDYTNVSPVTEAYKQYLSKCWELAKQKPKWSNH